MPWWVAWALLLAAVPAAFLGGVMLSGMSVYDRVVSGKVFAWRNRDYVCRPAKVEDYPQARPAADSSIMKIKAAMAAGEFDAEIARAIRRNAERNGV